MGCLTYLTTLLWIGRIAHTRGFPLKLTQFLSGDDANLVCTATNTTIKIEFTQWYMDDVRVLTSVFVGNTCGKYPPNSTGDTYAYSYDLYTSTDVSVSCGDYQHNMTLTTTQYLHAGTVWRCEDQRRRVSNNLTLGFAVTSNNTSPQQTESATTLAKLTTIKITTPPRNDNQGNNSAIIIMVMTGGGVVIFIISVLCLCFVRRQRRIGKATQDTLAHNGNKDPCYSEIKTEASRQPSIHANDVYYNTVSKKADYENPPMRT